MLVPALTVFILLGYAASLWWLLRRESAAAFVGIVGIAGVALGLRLFMTADFPAGLNEDEAKVLACSVKFLRQGNIFGEGCTGLPLLLTTLFEAQLVPWLGAGRWAIRTYSMALSVLSVPAAYATARGMGLRVAPALAAAAFVAVLPWSIFYGRVHQGGELLFHQLLLLAALARLIWAEGAWAEVAIGGFALGLSFYTYFSARSMLAMPFVASVLARGRRRVLCLLIAGIGVLGFVPYAMGGHQYALVGLSAIELHPEYQANAWATLRTKAIATVSALAWPGAQDGWLTITWAAVHPWLILGLALVGSLTGVRRAVFLWTGFAAGLTPSILAHGTLLASTHRMHAAYVFIVLAAAAALNLIRWRIPCALLSTAAVLVIGAQSVHLYFSPKFWPVGSRWIFDWENTGVVEALPVPPPPRIVQTDLGFYAAMRWDLPQPIEELTVDNWIPTGPSTYLFGWRTSPLQAFYESLLGPQRVQQSGRGFVVNFDSHDWSWLRQHGWTYEAQCGQTVRRGQVPTLIHVFYTFASFFCNGPAQHTWSGRWMGPASQLRLRFSGHAVVRTPDGVLAEGEGPENILDFSVDPGMDLTITLTTQPNPLTALYLMGTGTERLPYWEWVDPLPPPVASGG
jgi:hypothetical protein